MMNNVEGFNLELEARDDGDMEFEATNVEIGDNVIIIANELENGDPFYILLCNRPLHRCQDTFEDEWENIWYEGDMIIRGVWYQRVVNH
jgi:hypothetical protein